MTHTSELPNMSRTRRVLNSRLLQSLSYPHGVDAYLQAINPLWSANDVRARITAISRQTPDTVTIGVVPNRNWQGFQAGQYVRMSVEVDGVMQTRCFSPASAEQVAASELEFTCKINDSSMVSRFLRDQAEVGAVITLSQAEGQFALPSARPARMVLISGGSGITPVMSMLRTLCAEGYAGKISFLHYCNNAESLLYAEELSDLAARHSNLQLLRCFADAGQGGELEGLFTPEQLRAAIPDFDQAESFLCGPAGLMARVESAYAEADAAERLHQEHFVAANTHVADAANADGEVRFARSERLAANDGDTLLNQAEGAGLKPASGCRMGICFACTCKKTAGQVRDIRSGRVSSDGEENIQLCISVPVGTVVIDL